ncbi:hypothetical protein P691DRAFT_797346 [Macrolepiota fuliginosa MF-IS2]|uniref:Uncharacterized protein n=1 Tax=Macrolepiota fuliginosa MF-IS2 TaxID=1400762 RepID=A0A9P6BZJ8_9AGAR|nr:hypothetical protein P691DRAFT_797346 [Macrolepiota fuliginosa MF-IS2]
MNRLQLSISALSEEQLRNMVLRVAAQDPYFCDVIAMELGGTESYASDTDDASPTTPTMTRFPLESREKVPKRRGTRPRTLSKTLVHFPPDITGAAESDQEECHYHPGRVETEDYEFLTMNTKGRPYKVVQTVSMWSCCEGDDISPGCVIAPAHLLQHQPVQLRHRRTRAKSGDYPVKRGYRA